tara:strand:+ start:1283 stop:1579 length:297 start_codon:yes stop_codon:yes gene_type:complete
MQQLNPMLNSLNVLEEQRAKLMVELSKSLDLNDLPYDVFKHGSCKIAWQVKHGGVWTKTANSMVWAKGPKRVCVSRGDVDVVYIPENKVPSSVKRPWK